MKFGYARVSTKDQNLDFQLYALKKAGCEKIYSEHISGAKSDRAELQKLIAQLRAGDMVVVWKLDRLGRSLRDLVNLISQLQSLDVGFLSLQDNIDTTTPTGKRAFAKSKRQSPFSRKSL